MRQHKDDGPPELILLFTHDEAWHLPMPANPKGNSQVVPKRNQANSVAAGPPKSMHNLRPVTGGKVLDSRSSFIPLLCREALWLARRSKLTQSKGT